jgi:hypothetical protein
MFVRSVNAKNCSEDWNWDQIPAIANTYPFLNAPIIENTLKSRKLFF